MEDLEMQSVQQEAMALVQLIDSPVGQLRSMSTEGCERGFRRVPVIEQRVVQITQDDAHSVRGHALRMKAKLACQPVDVFMSLIASSGLNCGSFAFSGSSAMNNCVASDGLPFAWTLAF